MHLDVSVVIPTFRRPRLVLEAVESALAQEGASIEVLVLDDSPEGSARDAIEGIRDPRVRYSKRAVPSGGNPAQVRNAGAAEARGRFVHFLDDDDIVKPGAYRDAVAAFDRHPAAGVVFGRVEPFGEDAAALAHERELFETSARRARRFQRLGSPLFVAANQLYAHPTLMVNSACLIRREHVATLGGYDPRIAPFEDVEFYLRAMRRFGFRFLDRPMIGYRTGAPSIMRNLEDGTSIIRAYSRMYAKYRERHGALEMLALKVLAKTVLRWV